MTRKKLFIFGILALLLLFPTAIASADEEIGEGDVVNEGVTLFGEDLDLKRGGEINGDVVILDGKAELNGTINGDFVIIDGQVEIGQYAVLNGECMVIGGRVTGPQKELCEIVPVDEVMAEVNGLLVQFGIPPIELEAPLPPTVPDFPDPVVPEMPDPVVPEMPEMPDMPDMERPGPGRDWERDHDWDDYDNGPTFFGSISQSMFLGLMALLTMLFFPQHVEQVENAIRKAPAATGVIGLLSFVAIPSIMVIVGLLTALLIWICIGILGIPLLLLLGVGLIAGYLLGWIAVGSLFGDKLVEWLKWQKMTPAAKTAVGTAALTFLLYAITWLPLGGFVGGLISMVASCIGFGAVVLTQFGTKPYPRPVEPNAEKVAEVLNTLPNE